MFSNKFYYKYVHYYNYVSFKLETTHFLYQFSYIKKMAYANFVIP